MGMALNIGKNKACGNDRIFIGMFIALDEKVFDELAQCFRLRVLSHTSEVLDPVWGEYSVASIMKKVAPTSPADTRPIAVLPCRTKLFFAAWICIITPSTKTLSKYQFACREKHQAAECVLVL